MILIVSPIIINIMILLLIIIMIIIKIIVTISLIEPAPIQAAPRLVTRGPGQRLAGYTTVCSRL